LLKTLDLPHTVTKPTEESLTEMTDVDSLSRVAEGSGLQQQDRSSVQAFIELDDVVANMLRKRSAELVLSDGNTALEEQHPPSFKVKTSSSGCHVDANNIDIDADISCSAVQSQYTDDPNSIDI
jgi:hypothetical protein